MAEVWRGEALKGSKKTSDQTTTSTGVKVTRRRGALRIRANPVAASATLDVDVALRRRPVVVTAALLIPFRERKQGAAR